MTGILARGVVKGVRSLPVRRRTAEAKIALRQGIKPVELSDVARFIAASIRMNWSCDRSRNDIPDHASRLVAEEVPLSQGFSRAGKLYQAICMDREGLLAELLAFFDYNHESRPHPKKKSASRRTWTAIGDSAASTTPRERNVGFLATFVAGLANSRSQRWVRWTFIRLQGGSVLAPPRELICQTAFFDLP
ncbi:hypothetical protein B0H13DRAFT_1885269 [Mycena leptocephala]|nr:hypothetical protein B0H13DRAFT_1885269 [Mycena leptocephala]